MKATITDVPQPKPPRVVTLEMSYEDARRICYALGWPSSVAKAMHDVDATLFTPEEIKTAMTDAWDAFRAAGV